jgi:hypothetical protein
LSTYKIEDIKAEKERKEKTSDKEEKYRNE